MISECANQWTVQKEMMQKNNVSHDLITHITWHTRKQCRPQKRTHTHTYILMRPVTQRMVHLALLFPFPRLEEGEGVERACSEGEVCVSVSCVISNLLLLLRLRGPMLAFSIITCFLIISICPCRVSITSSFSPSSFRSCLISVWRSRMALISKGSASCRIESIVFKQWSVLCVFAYVPD